MNLLLFRKGYLIKCLLVTVGTNLLKGYATLGIQYVWLHMVGKLLNISFVEMGLHNDWMFPKHQSWKLFFFYSSELCCNESSWIFFLWVVPLFRKSIFVGSPPPPLPCNRAGCIEVIVCIWHSALECIIVSIINCCWFERWNFPIQVYHCIITLILIFKS